MGTTYKTLQAAASEILLIKKSKFICQAAPVSTEAEAQAYLGQIRKQYWDANHNCYACSIGLQAEIQKSSDDGEPSGTAGRPILEVIHKENILNAIVVVTRYFGGIQLGAGGLVRAYGQAAGIALHAAGIVTRQLFRQVSLRVDYKWVGTIERELATAGFSLKSSSYQERVTFDVMVPEEQTSSFAEFITDLTHGQAEIELLDTAYS